MRWRSDTGRIGNPDDRESAMRMRRGTRAERGFTLIEIIVVAGVAAVFLLLSASVLSDIQALKNQSQSEITAETDLSFAVGYMIGLLREAGNSYNSMSGVLDDEGQEFFDYYYDVPVDSWSEAEKSRILTLSPESGRLDLVLLLNVKGHDDQIFYQPIWAYAPQNAPADMSVSAPLNYVGINNGGVISSRYPEVWKNGQLFMLRVPIPLRYVAADATVNIESPPREHLFLGRVQQTDLVQETLGGIVHATHPVDNQPIPNPDRFLRTIPVVGGASPIVKMDPIRAVRIALRPDPSSQDSYNLYVEEYVNGAFGAPFMIATSVNAVVFQRVSVASPVIGVKISVNK